MTWQRMNRSMELETSEWIQRNRPNWKNETKSFNTNGLKKERERERERKTCRGGGQREGELAHSVERKNNIQ